MRKDRPSRTAFKIAMNTITLSSKPGMAGILPKGIASATEKLLVASEAASEMCVKWVRMPGMVWIYEAFDWMLPGQFEALAHRKQFCERQAREGIDSGASQILVLGAGYDTLCWRLSSEYVHSVNFFEIDHPATAEMKAKGIEKMGRRENHHLIAEDLNTKQLSKILSDHPQWHSEARSVIIAEGLVMYLTPEAVRELFRQCALVTGKGSRMAFSYIPASRDGQPDAGRFTEGMLWLQTTAGEPWLWFISPEEIIPFLRQTGWTHTTDYIESDRKFGVEYYALALK